jgi:phage tail tape-measure protein
LAKVVASKTVGGAAAGAAGAAAGATAGTVVPGVGTAVGAVIGFIGGLVVGVSVDKLLIELEEAISREEFKKSILSAIDEARVEFKAKLKVQTSSNTDLGHYATY